MRYFNKYTGFSYTVEQNGREVAITNRHGNVEKLTLRQGEQLRSRMSYLGLVKA